MRPDHDVIVVGASLAGCTAATLLARQGARVALVERAADMDAYKVVCGHFIQASAVPTLRRLGVEDELRSAGAVGNHFEAYTPFGVIRPPKDPDGTPLVPAGLNLRRQTLDPLLRRLAAGTPGVDLHLGARVEGLLRDGAGRPAGVRAIRRDGEAEELRARVVVGADGRSSTVARLARRPARVRDNGRFCYFAYFRGVKLATETSSQVWFMDPDTAYAFLNEDGVTLIAAFPTKARLAEFKADREAAYDRFVSALPDAPDLSQAERVSSVMGKVDFPSMIRRAAAPGVAFVGDAAMASDPVWGVGCGFALQSADWLAEALGPGLPDGQVDDALETYRRRHRKRLLGHHLLMCDYSTGRPFNAVDRLLYDGAVRDPLVARGFLEFGARLRTPAQALTPRLLARAAVARRRPAPSAAVATAA